jgi:hypothetical protein
MFLSFGPQGQQYRAYVGADATEKPRNGPADHRLVTFYNETRAKACPATFSAISGVGPLVVFSGPVVLLAGLLAEGSQPDGLKRQFGGAATAKIAVGSG